MFVAAAMKMYTFNSILRVLILLKLNFIECLVPMYYGFNRPALVYDLPPLPYSFSDLQPFIDKETVKIHYEGHHAKYKDNLNNVLQDWHRLGKEAARYSIIDVLKNTSLIPPGLRQKFINNAGGYVNHAFYWELMYPNPEEVERQPFGNIASGIINTFHSFKQFKTRFSDAANKLFGSGYVWLCQSYPDNKPTKSRPGELLIVSTANQDIPLTNGLFPVLVLDVWEHSYYLKHKNHRAKYTKDWWNLINWQAVNELDQWWLGLYKHDEL